MKPHELLRSLKQKDPAPAYFFHGSEKFLKNKAITKILEVIPDGQRDFNYDLYYGAESGMDEVLSAVRTLPFLASRRVVVLRDLDRVKAAGPKAEALVAYLSDPSPAAVFILTTEDQGAARTWGKKCAGLWSEVDFRPLRGSALAAAVKVAAGERSRTITDGAVERLIETAGSDLARITGEVEKLALATDEGGRIDEETVSLMVGGYSFQTSFDLVQAICSRDLPEALKLIDRLFVSGSETAGLVGMLARRLRILWYLAPGDGGPAPVPSVFRVQKWQMRDLEKQAGAFTKERIEGLLDDLLKIDRLVKSTPASPRLLLEDFLLRLDSAAQGR